MGFSSENSRRTWPGLPSASLMLEEVMSALQRKSEAARHDQMQSAFAVLSAARDLGDLSSALTARKVIDTYLRGEQPREADLKIINSYFR